MARVLIGFDVPAGFPVRTFSADLVRRLRACGIAPASVLVEESCDRLSGDRSPLFALWADVDGRAVRAVVEARDGEVCRLCATPAINTQARRDPQRRVFVMVDPFGPVSADNVVVACLRCATTLNGRAPDAAGMTVRAAPVHSPAPTRRRASSKKGASA